MLGLCRNTWSCCWKKKLFAHISKKWTLKVNLGSNWVFGYLSIGYLSISTFESLPCAIKYARMVEASGWQGEEKNLEKTWSTTKQKLKSCGKPAGGHILVGSRQNCTYSWQFIFYHLHSHWIKFVWITKNIFGRQLWLDLQHISWNIYPALLNSVWDAEELYSGVKEKYALFRGPMFMFMFQNHVYFLPPAFFLWEKGHLWPQHFFRYFLPWADLSK